MKRQAGSVDPGTVARKRAVVAGEQKAVARFRLRSGRRAGAPRSVEAQLLKRLRGAKRKAFSRFDCEAHTVHAGRELG